ncbi:hypothetical protein FOXYSP1_20239 [Fusarium oxysporum f. sp. phaseoli]
MSYLSTLSTVSSNLSQRQTVSVSRRRTVFAVTWKDSIRRQFPRLSRIVRSFSRSSWAFLIPSATILRRTSRYSHGKFLSLPSRRLLASTALIPARRPHDEPVQRRVCASTHASRTKHGPSSP